MKTKLLYLLCTVTTLFFSNNSSAQTTLTAGDIAVIMNQADTPDGFAFVTFVDLDPGTVIYFTDCGVVPAGTFDPAGCGEGAVAYTVPAGGKMTGDIIMYDDSSPSSEFTDYPGDSTILGGSGPSLSTGGDQIIVFQATGNPGGSSVAGTIPTFIFVINNASTLFTGDDSSSTTETGLPNGLSDVSTPRTALAVGSGTGASDEFDNTVYSGTYDFSSYPDLPSSIAAAKAALTDPANYTKENGITSGTYPTDVAAIPSALMLFTLSTTDFNIENVIMYPNPAQDYITISNSSTVNKVVIHDVTGKEVMRTNIVNNRVNISQLKSGMYLVNLVGNQGNIVKKLLKL